MAGTWLWRRFGNVSALDLVLPVVSG